MKKNTLRLSTEFHLFSVIHEKKTFNRYRYHKCRAGGNRGMVGVKDTIAPIDFGRFSTDISHCLGMNYYVNFLGAYVAMDFI